jgi:hypothetical protein
MRCVPQNVIHTITFPIRRGDESRLSDIERALYPLGRPHLD